MEVFIGNLPMQATLEELRRFFGGLELKASFDCRRGQTSENHCYFYLVAHTKNEAEGQDLILRLNGTLLLDKHIVARPLAKRQSSEAAPGSDDVEVGHSEFNGKDRRLNADDAAAPLVLFPAREPYAEAADAEIA
jgi:hypothetical protein